MRIALISNLYPPEVLGGYELIAADLVAHLRARGHAVSVLSTGGARGEPDLTRSLALVRPFSSPPRRDRLRHVVLARGNRRATESFLETTRPDVALVMSMRRLGLEPLRVLARRRVPCVVTVNDDWPAAYIPLHGTRRLGTWLDRVPPAVHTWRGIEVDRVLYVSEAIRDHVRRLGAPLPSGRVCAHGIDLARFPPRPFRPIGQPPRLLVAGRLHPSKAPELALDALAALERRGFVATLELVGDPMSPAYGDELRARARQTGVAERVVFHRAIPQDRMPERYHAADVVLFFSTGGIEGQGMTYLEAMACGVPVIACPDGGARELLDRATACVRPRPDALSIAQAIEELARDPGEQQRLYDAGLAFVREHASLTRCVDVLEAELVAATRTR